MPRTATGSVISQIHGPILLFKLAFASHRTRLVAGWERMLILLVANTTPHGFIPKTLRVARLCCALSNSPVGASSVTAGQRPRLWRKPISLLLALIGTRSKLRPKGV